MNRFMTLRSKNFQFVEKPDPLKLFRELERRVRRLEQNRLHRSRNGVLMNFRRRAIRALYLTGKLTMEELGNAFGLTPQRIQQIIKASHEIDHQLTNHKCNLCGKDCGGCTKHAYECDWLINHKH
jgi:hypothetical protein